MLLPFMVYSCCLSLKALPESEGAICCFARLFLRGQFAARLPLSWAGGGFFMSEKRLAVISLIVENREQSARINGILSDYACYIVARMGVPYKERGVSVICLIVDAPNEIINTVTGKIGMLEGVSAKTLVSKLK